MIEYLPIHIPIQHDLSALHIAAWKGNTDIVEMLIAEGCRLEQKSKVTHPAVHLGMLSVLAVMCRK